MILKKTMNSTDDHDWEKGKCKVHERESYLKLKITVHSQLYELTHLYNKADCTGLANTNEATLKKKKITYKLCNFPVFKTILLHNIITFI